MEEVNVKAVEDLNELAIDVLQGLIVGLEGIDQLRLRVHDLLRKHDGTDPFQSVAPLGNIGAVVRCAQEEDAVSGYEDGAIVLGLQASDFGAVDQGPLDHQTSQAMGHPNDGTLGSFAAAVGDQLGNQMFGVVVYLIFRGAIGEACDIGIVSIDQDASLQALILEFGGEGLSGPEDVCAFAGPSVAGLAVQAVDENDVDIRPRGWGVDLC